MDATNSHESHPNGTIVLNHANINVNINNNINDMKAFTDAMQNSVRTASEQIFHQQLSHNTSANMMGPSSMVNNTNNIAASKNLNTNTSNFNNNTVHNMNNASGINSYNKLHNMNDNNNINYPTSAPLNNLLHNSYHHTPSPSVQPERNRSAFTGVPIKSESTGGMHCFSYKPERNRTSAISDQKNGNRCILLFQLQT